jgi:hypothetical protein
MVLALNEDGSSACLDVAQMMTYLPKQLVL